MKNAITALCVGLIYFLLSPLAIGQSPEQLFDEACLRTKQIPQSIARYAQHAGFSNVDPERFTHSYLGPEFRKTEMNINNYKYNVWIKREGESYFVIEYFIKKEDGVFYFDENRNIAVNNSETSITCMTSVYGEEFTFDGKVFEEILNSTPYLLGVIWKREGIERNTIFSPGFLSGFIVSREQNKLSHIGVAWGNPPKFPNFPGVRIKITTAAEDQFSS